MGFLDKRDRRILFELDQNARVSFARLGQLLAMSQETVRYRVRRLEQKGVIKKYFTIVDSSKLGYAFYKVLLKLHSATEPNVEEILAFLQSTENLTWLVRLDGGYDIGFVVRVENVVSLSRLLDQVAERFSGFISKRSVSINVVGQYLPRHYLAARKRVKVKLREYSAEKADFELDESDRIIVSCLTSNGRMSAAAISRHLLKSGQTLAFTPEGVSGRIKRLEEQGIIVGYNIVLNHQAMDQLHYKILVNLNSVGPQQGNYFAEACIKEPNVVYLIKALGEWDYELDLEVEHVEQYREVMARLAEACPGIVRDYTALLVTEIYLYNLFPGLLGEGI